MPQCHGCAYNCGGAANREPENYLRGVFAALGGFPFYCHESMGWAPEAAGYPHGAENALVLLVNRHEILHAVPESASAIATQTAAFQKQLRICSGWKASVRYLHSQGWYRDRDLRLVRRCMAKAGTEALAGITEEGISARVKEARIQGVRDTVKWFVHEARAARISIAWLFVNGR